MEQRQTKSATTPRGKSGKSDSRATRILVAMTAGIVFVLAGVGALFQQPHPDPFRVTRSWDVFDLDWWRYPVEQNAFKRLPVVRGNLNSVFVLPGTEQVWAVGDGGLIVHSADGGKTWEQQRPAPVPPPATTSRFPEFISTAHAETGTQQAPTQRPTFDITDVPQRSFPNQAAQPAPVKRAPPAAPAVVEKQATPSPRKETTVPLAGAAKGNASASSNLQAQQRIEPTAPVIPPPPDDANLSDIFFIDATRGWAVGMEGTILATADAGRSWQAQTSGTWAWLRSVQFANTIRGWAVGDGGMILATTDGGRSWQAETNGTPQWLYSVQFVDATRGWAVGDLGAILATNDAGRSWQGQTSRTMMSLRSVQFVDATRGWAVGMEGTILATTDAGRSWQVQPSGTTAVLTSVQFVDATRGWAVGEYGTILTTSDAGHSWQVQPSGTTAVLTSVQFLDATRGWAVGHKGTILTTTNAGRSWQAQTRGRMASLTSVRFLDTMHGWVAGSLGTILTTADAGRSWQTQTRNRTAWLWSVQFLDAMRGWAVGMEGTILATTDAGRSWQAQTSGTTEFLYSVQFLNATHGWAVGDEGTILASTDAGRSWQAQTSGTSVGLRAVQFLDATRGWAVGEGGMILTTADAGRSWQIQSNGTKTSLTSVQFLDATRGWAVGKNGTIIRTIDSGSSWQAQTSGTIEWLSSVQFLDATRGWVVGVEGTILTTADAGRSWQAQTSGTSAGLTSVQFLDAARGWAVGENGTILTTADGGKTWEDIARYSRSPAPWVYAQLFPALLFAAWAVRRRQPVAPSQATAGVAGIFVSDRPLQPGDVDHLGHGVVARGLANFIRNENTEPGLTVAVTGAWGLGKSSVMRLLEHALQSAGFRTAWFNAWHHQQEGRQLASMLNAIRWQAIPPGLSVKGLRLRGKLLWQRGWWYRSMLLVLLLVVTVAVCGLRGEDQPLEQIWRNIAYHLLERKPTVLTDASLRRIEKDAVTAPDAIEFMRTHMLWHPTPGSNGSKDACLAITGDCVFENHAQLLTALEQKLNRTLPAEERASITSAAQHLPPPPLLEGLSVIGALAGTVLLLFVGKGFTVFGLDVAGLLGRLIPGQRREASKEAVGTLEHFRHEFGLITEALEGRLVLFIDDLDRCHCATVREVLDMVNYLVSTGRCFVVLGVAMEHIECCIEPKSPKQPQDDYAKEYLKKLINIEVPVPVAPLIHSRRMLEQQAVEARAVSGLNWRRGSRRILVTAILAGIVGFGYWFNALIPTPPVEFRAPLEATQATTPNTLTPPPAQPRGKENLPEPRDNTVGVQAAPEVSTWPAWFVVILAAIFVVAVGVLSFFPHERLRQWREKWFKRAKIAAGGAERTIDSQDFVRALTAWHGVIALGDPTPRGIKRFVNRVRLFAMREQAVFDDGTAASRATSDMRRILSGPLTETPLDDATLVALAALHHINDDETFNPEKAFEKGHNNAREVQGNDDDNAHAIGLAIREHKHAGLPWPPTPEQIERFKVIAQGFHIR